MKLSEKPENLDDAAEDLDEKLADLAARVGSGSMGGDDLAAELVELARERLETESLGSLAALSRAPIPWQEIDWTRVALAVSDGLRTWAKYRPRRK